MRSCLYACIAGCTGAVACLFPGVGALLLLGGCWTLRAEVQVPLAPLDSGYPLWGGEFIRSRALFRDGVGLWLAGLAGSNASFLR